MDTTVTLSSPLHLNLVVPLVLASLATWRLTHLLVREDGPWDVIARLRAALGEGRWGRMFDCFYCMSLWVAAPMAWWVMEAQSSGLTHTAIAWLALSGAACLCERASSPQPEVVMHALPSEPLNEGEQHELLRTTT